MMTGKEKLYFLLDTIDDKRILTASGQPVLIHPLGDLNAKYPDTELLLLLKKLQDDLKILKVTRIPLSDEEKGYSPRYEDDYYGLEILPAFDDYLTKIQKEPEYQEFTGKKPKQAQEVKETEKRSDIVFEITYTEAREVLLNEYLQLAKPDFDRENDLVFEYLVKNPNRTIQQSEIEDTINSRLTKSLHKIVENLGFIGDLRKVFFDISKSAIYFRNPVTKPTLERLSMSKIKLPR